MFKLANILTSYAVMPFIYLCLIRLVTWVLINYSDLHMTLSIFLWVRVYSEENNANLNSYDCNRKLGSGTEDSYNVAWSNVWSMDKVYV